MTFLPPRPWATGLITTVKRSRHLHELGAGLMRKAPRGGAEPAGQVEGVPSSIP
jgi:hypothetical protein